MTSFVDFLAAKRTVEDRALNRPVFDRFVTELAGRADRTTDPIRIVEIGVGTGSMIARLAEWDALPPAVSYRAVDLNKEVLSAARRRLPERLRAAGYTVDRQSARMLAHRRLDDGTQSTLELSLEVGDGFSLTDEADAVIASAVLDLVDLDSALTGLGSILRHDGLLYAPMTFNGRTSFSPDDPLDDRIERLYHRHMDEVRDQPGGSQAGHDLLDRLPAAGYTVLEAGGGDWIVRPVDGAYPHAESTMLAHLLATIDEALADYPDDVLSTSTRQQWIETRTDQLDRGELSMVAHHLDVLARFDGL